MINLMPQVFRNAASNTTMFQLQQRLGFHGGFQGVFHADKKSDQRPINEYPPNKDLKTVLSFRDGEGVYWAVIRPYGCDGRAMDITLSDRIGQLSDAFSHVPPETTTIKEFLGIKFPNYAQSMEYVARVFGR